MENDNKIPEMKIDISNEVAEGIYSNLAVISHSPSEFVLDFVRTLPNATPRVKSRIVMTPAHVKRLLIALSENITKYERKFGKIHLPEESNTVVFPGVQGQA